jgi:signal peptidase I
MRARLREVLITLILALCIFLAVQVTIQSCQVNGYSMEPSLYEGQRILVIKAVYWFGDPQRGDVIIFTKPGADHKIIHRVVGLPGELVEIRSGELYIDGVKIEEQYTQGHSVSASSRRVPEGCYFIIGDNRGGTAWDIVPRDNIIGKAWLCYWPLSEWGLLPSYSYAQD